MKILYRQAEPWIREGAAFSASVHRCTSAGTLTMIPSLLPLIAPPASARVRGPLGRRPTVDDRAPREC